VNVFPTPLSATPVNLTARMEGLNKLFGTNIVVSEATLVAAGEGFSSRFLGLIAVVGKQEPVAVYELLQPIEIEEAEKQLARTEMLRHYAEGISLSKELRYSEATSAFERALAIMPEDGPSLFHLKNLATLAENPLAKVGTGSSSPLRSRESSPLPGRSSCAASLCNPETARPASLRPPHPVTLKAVAEGPVSRSLARHGASTGFLAVRARNDG